MSYSGTEAETIKVSTTNVSNLILNDASPKFNVNVEISKAVNNIISSLTSEIEELKKKIQNQETSSIKTGIIQPYAGMAINTETYEILPPPDGYEWCFGQIVSKTDEKYANLYSVIRDYWNTSTELTEDQFQLPDLRNVFLRGCPEYNESSENNRFVGNFQPCGAPNVQGQFGGIAYDTSITGAFQAQTGLSCNYYDGKYTLAYSIDYRASRSSSVYQDGLTEVRPDNKAVNYIIKL